MHNYMHGILRYNYLSKCEIKVGSYLNWSGGQHIAIVILRKVADPLPPLSLGLHFLKCSSDGNIKSRRLNTYIVNNYLCIKVSKVSRIISVNV